MEITCVNAVFYSATGNTRKVTCEIAKQVAGILKVPLTTYDFSLPKNRISQQYDRNQLVIFGTPVYAGRIPNKMLPFVQTLFQGNGALAVPVVTFGNRSYDNALLELRNELTLHGFHPVAAGAFAAQHAFTKKLAGGRPDEKDMELLYEFAAGIADKVLHLTEIPEPVSVPRTEPVDAYYTPLGTDGKPAVFLKAKPRTADSCTDCKVCVSLCPMGSIDYDNPASVPGVCIKCQACVKGCPENAKYFDDPAFLSHVKMLEQNYTRRTEPEMFL